MGKFNRYKPKFDRRSSGRSSDRPGRFRERDFDRPGRSFDKEKFTVNCDKCGEECEVPFKPTMNKPVYCSSCFRKNEKQDSRSESRYESRGSSRQSGDKLDEINSKLDKIMRALEID